MTTIKKDLRSYFWIAIMFYINSCNPCKEKNSYLKSANIQDSLDKTITSVFTSMPYPNLVTVYFTESGMKKYIFVTPHLSIENIRSKYYFMMDKKPIIIGYKNENMEKRFAKLKCSKPEKKFNYTEGKMDIYDGRRVVFEIVNDNSIQEINPSEEILELNDYGNIMFIPPVKK